MDSDDGDSGASLDSLVLDLAAHPLSSCNPPPEDLADILDSLVASHAQMRQKLDLVQDLASRLVKRVINIKHRLEELRRAYPHLRSNLFETTNGSPTSKQQRCFNACHELYQRMFLQACFMHHCLAHNINDVLLRHMNTHETIFLALLGDRHEHVDLHPVLPKGASCVSGCNWYDVHGPHEWSKKPYTAEWLEEMNNTSWDWVLLRHHIAQVMGDAEHKALFAANTFLSCAHRFVPFWFWGPDYEKWFPWLEISPAETQSGAMEGMLFAKIRFAKTGTMIARQRAEVHAGEDSRDVEGGAQAPNSLNNSEIHIDPMGLYAIDPGVVFDGNISMPDWSNGGQLKPLGSWIKWWGYEKWFNMYASTAISTTDLPDAVQKAPYSMAYQRSARSPCHPCWPYDTQQ